MFKVISKGSSRNAFSDSSTSEPSRAVTMKEEENVLSKEHTHTHARVHTHAHRDWPPRTPFHGISRVCSLTDNHRPSQVSESAFVTDLTQEDDEPPEAGRVPAHPRCLINVC